MLALRVAPGEGEGFGFRVWSVGFRVGDLERVSLGLRYGAYLMGTRLFLRFLEPVLLQLRSMADVYETLRGPPLSLNAMHGPWLHDLSRQCMITVILPPVALQSDELKTDCLNKRTNPLR